MTHPFRKRWFRQISLNIAAAMRASKKNSISTNRKSTTRFPASHRWTVYVTPKSPKGWLKTRILHLALPVISSLQVIVDISNLIYRLELETSKFSVHVDHTKFQPTDDKLSLKEAWSLSRDLFNFWKISDKISKTVRDSLIVSIKFE